MTKIKKFTKKELVEKAGKFSFFKKKGVKEVWGRENGHFYYGKPPRFIDGLESFKITREDVEGKAADNVEYPMNGKDTAKAIGECKTKEELDALVTEGKLLKDDARKGVIKALKEKNEELSPKGE